MKYKLKDSALKKLNEAGVYPKIDPNNGLTMNEWENVRIDIDPSYFIPIPERIKLVFSGNLTKILKRSGDGDNFTQEQINIMESAINGETLTMEQIEEIRYEWMRLDKGMSFWCFLKSKFQK